MHINSGKLAALIFILAATGYGIYISSAHPIRPAVGSELPVSNVAATAIKVENISMDYAPAHAAVMKTPDEARVNTF